MTLSTIVTASSTYYVDRDAALVTRMPGLGATGEFDVAALRRDGETLPLLSCAEPVVGESWELLIMIRDDGIPTVRTTTPVREICAWGV